MSFHLIYIILHYRHTLFHTYLSYCYNQSVMKYLVLLLIQSIAEIFPVSSSAHLLLAGKLLNVNMSTDILTFMQLPSAIAILLFFRKDIINILKNVRHDRRLMNRILITMPPAIFAGFFLSSLIETYFHASATIAINLAIWGLAMILVEILHGSAIYDNVEDMPMWKTGVIGLFQVFALLPGTSRSGVTTTSAVFLGLKKDIAVKFSFLIGLPIIFGSMLYEFISSDMKSFSTVNLNPWILSGGAIAGFLVSYLALKLLMRLAKKRFFLTGFGLYRIFLAILIYLLRV